MSAARTVFVGMIALSFLPTLFAQPQKEPEKTPKAEPSKQDSKPDSKPGLPADASASKEDLPKAETVLDGFIEAAGGKAAYEKIKNQVIHGRLELSGSEIKATMKTYRAPPNKYYLQVNIEGIGMTEEGATDEHAWIRTSHWANLKTGTEKAAGLRDAVFQGELHWRKLFKEVECTGVEKVDGKPCYRVVCTAPDGEQEARYYDKETRLLTKTGRIVKSEHGDFTLENYFADFKDVDGIKIPHKISVKASNNTQLITVEKIEHNVDIPADRFDPPADVKAKLPAPATEAAPAQPAEKKP